MFTLTFLTIAVAQSTAMRRAVSSSSTTSESVSSSVTSTSVTIDGRTVTSDLIRNERTSTSPSGENHTESLSFSINGDTAFHATSDDTASLHDEEAMSYDLNITGKSSLPSYKGDADIFGNAKLIFVGTQVSIAYNLTPLQSARCTQRPNACGIHIHMGTNCSNPGTHFWKNTTGVTTDPWTAIAYKHEEGETTSTDTTEPIDIGYNATEAAGHVFIVHDVNGAQAACTVLVSLEDPENDDDDSDEDENDDSDEDENDDSDEDENDDSDEDNAPATSTTNTPLSHPDKKNSAVQCASYPVLLALAAYFVW